MRRGATGAAVLALVALSGCGTGGGGTGVAALRPSDGRSGVYVTGTLGGRQVAVSEGAPVLIVGDCDPQDGPDRDVCFSARDIDGRPTRIILENPDALRAGARLPVIACEGACEDVADGIVVDVDVQGDRRRRATGGTVELDVVEPYLRYAGSLNLTLPDGRLSGDVNVVPRPEEDA